MHRNLLGVGSSCPQPPGNHPPPELLSKQCQTQQQKHAQQSCKLSSGNFYTETRFVSLRGLYVPHSWGKALKEMQQVPATPGGPCLMRDTLSSPAAGPTWDHPAPAESPELALPTSHPSKCHLKHTTGQLGRTRPTTLHRDFKRGQWGSSSALLCRSRGHERWRSGETWSCSPTHSSLAPNSADTSRPATPTPPNPPQPA